jgi:parvulin-like peptidyl-prolyl isomerase
LDRDDTYRHALAQFKDQWKHRLKEYEETLLIESYLRQLRSKELAVTDQEVQRFFNDHALEFQKPVEVQARHILLSSPEEAQRALARIQAGEPFEKVAQEMSKDPVTAARGGQLNAFHRGMLVPEFEEAAIALNPGEISGVVKTQFGFHIIKKTGQKQLPPQSFADAKEEIRARLEREKFDQWVTSKQSSMGVRMNEQVMDALAKPDMGHASQEP